MGVYMYTSPHRKLYLELQQMLQLTKNSDAMPKGLETLLNYNISVLPFHTHVFLRLHGWGHGILPER